MFIDPTKGEIPYHLESAIKDIWTPAGLTVTKQAVRELESVEYGACRLELEGKKIIFRVAKTTPTKIGQFVTIWKRPVDVTMPFDSEDAIDFIVIDVREGNHVGQFIFDRKVLIEKRIISCGNKKGKMGIRVYPPWTKPIAKQAIKTQEWQLQSFYALGSDICQVRNYFKQS